MKLPKMIVSATLALSATVVSVPVTAQVVETFATFAPIDDSRNVYWDNDNGVSAGTGGSFFSTGSATSITPGSRNVSFSFLTSGLAAINNVTAVFNMFATAPSGNPASQVGSFRLQGGIGGSFSFTTTQAVGIGNTVFAAGSNLLTGMFVNASIVGSAGSGSALSSGSDGLGQSLVYTSDFLDTSILGSEQFAMSLSGISDPLAATPGSALRDFSATATGSFSAAFAPAVPEPGTWAMMIIGFGFVGGTLRYRRRKSTFAIA